MEVEEVIAREEIRKTMAIYSMAGDRGRFQELASTFAEDGVLVSWTGRKAIAEGMIAAREAGMKADGAKVGFSLHNLTTCHIEFVSKCEANAWTYFQVISDFGLDHAGVYIDNIKKYGERWLFVRRRVKIKWDSPDSLFHQPNSV